MEGISFKERIEELGRKLGIPEEKIKQAYPEYWDIFYEEIGAKTGDIARNRLHTREDEIRKCHIIVPTASIAAVSVNPDNKYCVLVERRHSIQGPKQIKLPGGRSKMWSYAKVDEPIEKVELEHPMLTAYREWKEAVGGMLNYQARELTITTSRTDGAYSNKYNLNIFYYVEVPWDYMKKQVFPKESVLGGEPRIKIIPIEELRSYPWHPDAEECFELLIKMFS